MGEQEIVQPDRVLRELRQLNFALVVIGALLEEWATPPLVFSFTGLHVTDMDGEDRDPEITCPAVQTYNATAAAWENVTKTASAWRAFTATPTHGLYSWDQSPPPDGALRTLPAMSFHVTQASGQALGLDGFGE